MAEEEDADRAGSACEVGYLRSTSSWFDQEKFTDC